jgi:AAA+ ATPase superfamily predicted ATPase
MPVKEFKDSPFYPGKVIPVDYFVARDKEINEIRRIVRQSSSGRNESVFIQGERGIGKSSLADFVLTLAEKELNYIGAHCYLSGAKSLEDVVRHVFQRLINKTNEKDLFEKLNKVFGGFIKSLAFYGMGVEFTRQEDELKRLVENFPFMLEKLFDTVKDKKNGILLILDDLNGLSDAPDFSPFIKSFFDELSSDFPITLVMVGLPERRRQMIRHQPSVARIFKLIELNPLNKDEAKQFFLFNFNRVEIEIDEKNLDSLVYISGGFPALMHEVGDAVFLRDNDGIIDNSDCLGGILNASYDIGKRYIDEQIIKELQSETYMEILKKIAKHKFKPTFTRQDLLKLCHGKETEKEKRGIDNFIRRLKKLEMIVEADTRGKYKFVNLLYPIYLNFFAFEDNN